MKIEIFRNPDDKEFPFMLELFHENKRIGVYRCTAYMPIWKIREFTEKELMKHIDKEKRD